MSAASASGAVSPPPTVGNVSVGAGGDNWAAAWHDSGKMNVSSGSSNRSAVSSPPAPAVNPFTVATNLTQLNTSPWPSSSGTSPVTQPSKNHYQQQQQQQRHVPSQQQQQQQQQQPPQPPQPQPPVQPQASFTPQWPSSSSTAINDPFNISNENLGGELHTMQYQKEISFNITNHYVRIQLFIVSCRISHLLCCSWIVQVGCSQVQLPHLRVGPHSQATTSINIFSEVRCRWWRECLWPFYRFR